MSSIFPEGMFPELDAYIKSVIYIEMQKHALSMPPPEIDKDEIWTLKKAASVIGISTQTLSKMLLRGEIVGVKPGRKWKLTKHNVTNYMNRNRN
ncbi:MAG: Helix-turn-helix domain [Bacteroidota bacterium]|jgi:excisionase family DNA binding protein